MCIIVTKYNVCNSVYIDIEIAPEEYPHSIGHSSSSQFKLRRKKGSASSLQVSFRSVLSSPTSSHLSPPLDFAGSSYDGSSLADLSTTELMTGKLKLHSELVDALHEFASHSNAEGLFETSGGKTRETVLEQALIEQNQILDVMQELISTLESENKHSRNTINKQGRVISGWEVKSKQDEKALAELRSKPQALSLKRDDPQIAGLKRQLVEKEQTIQSLRSRLKHESESLLAAKLTSMKTKLEIERVRCIEMEEELSQVNGRITKFSKEAAEKESIMISKESEIMHLKHEMKSLRNFQQQQQDLVMKQRAILSSKDVQLRSLTRALHKEKKVADQLRRIQVSSSCVSRSPSIISIVGNARELNEVQYGHQISLFEQIAGRTTHSIELTRVIPETELGFSFTKVDLPVSSRIPCLIVKAVKEGSLADSMLRAGDELLEVNGILCRSLQQSRAVNTLEKGLGVLKVVVARMFDYSSLPNKAILHSTPIKLMDGFSNGEVSSTWATALHSQNTTFQSFSVDTSIVRESQNEDAEFVTPESYALPVMRNDSDDQVVDVPAASEQLHHQDPGEKQCPSTPTSVSSAIDSESLITVSSKDAVSVKKLQYEIEIADLQDQLDKSERIRLNFESVINATHDELAHIKSDNEAVMSKNDELQQQLFSRDSEISDIQQYISELQKVLVVLQSELVDDQQRIASLENQNKMISGELMEATGISSQASKMKGNLEEMVRELKSELEKREKEVKEMETALQEHTLKNTQLGSDATHMENELEKLRDSLKSSKQESEVMIAALKQECQQLRSQWEEATEVSKETKISSQKQYEHLNTQLKSAKSLLMEAEVKDSQLQVELRYHKQAADLANKQFEKIEAEYHRTLEELRYFKQEAERRTLEMESMTVGLKGAQMMLEGKQEMTTRLQTETDNLRRTNAKLKNESIHLKERARETESNFKASSAEEKRLGEKLHESNIEKNELFVQLENSFEESTELSFKVEELEGELKRLKEEYASASKNELVNSLKLSEARLQGELESSRKRIEVFTQQSSRMKSEIKTFQSQCEDMASELKQTRSEKEHLTASKDELSKEIAEMQERHSNIHYELDSKQQEVDAIKTTLMQLQEQLRIEKEHSATYMGRISWLESELEQVQSEKKKAEDMLASLEFIQKQDQEKLDHAKQFVRDKEKSSRRMSVQIDDVNEILHKSKLENTALTTSVASMKQQLKESQRVHAEALKSLQEELALKEKKLTHISYELESHRSKSEMLNGKAEHLVKSMEKLAKEKHSLEETLEINVNESSEIQNLNQQLEGQVDRLKAELENMINSSNSLSSESAGLRQQLRQREQEIDQLTAQLHAAEINLEVTRKTIHESERVSTTQMQKLENLESQYRESHSKMEDYTSQLESSSLELCKRDEELSKLRTTLELCQQDSCALQDFLIVAQNGADVAKKRIQELDAEHCKLLSAISELQDEKKMAQELIKSLHKEKTSDDNTQKKSADLYQAKIEDLQCKEKEHTDKINRLKSDNQELEKSRNELISARDEMKTSISKIGNEKDIEIITLQDEVRTLNQKFDNAEEQHNCVVENEKVLKEQVVRMEHKIADLEEQIMKEKSCNDDLKCEIEVHQVTAQEIQTLNEKVMLLSDRLRTKTKQLTELEETHNSTEAELREMQLESKALLDNVSEVATLKLTVVDQAEAIEVMKKKLTKKEAIYKQVLKERDQFLSTVRELEVLKHTSENPMNFEQTTESTGIEIKEKEELIQIIQQKEDEVLRTQEYSEQLLFNVMMKAPFLLEK